MRVYVNVHMGCSYSCFDLALNPIDGNLTSQWTCSWFLPLVCFWIHTEWWESLFSSRDTPQHTFTIFHCKLHESKASVLLNCFPKLKCIVNTDLRPVSWRKRLLAFSRSHFSANVLKFSGSGFGKRTGRLHSNAHRVLLLGFHRASVC